jgi:hypothetical protein
MIRKFENKFRNFGIRNNTIMAQVLDKEMLKYWEQLDTPQKKSILGVIKSILQPAEKSVRVSIEQYNKEIDEAMARMDAGQFTTHEEVEKEMEKW